MVAAYYFITLIYSSFIIWVRIQLNRHRSVHSHAGIKARPVSVLVPFRNELPHLKAILNSLKNQKIDRELFEVILIDDHSNDKGTPLCKDFISDKGLTNFHLISLNSGKPSKKKAIREGMKKAKYEWILQTDADCMHSENWIFSYARLTGSGLKFISGPVLIRGKGLAGKLLEIESWALIAITALGIIKKSPQMSNGANMLWNKSTLTQEKLDQIYGSEIKSGDDQFLMNAFAAHNPDCIGFNWSKEALVSTTAPDNITGFISQRLRWASKWKKSETISQWVFPALLWLYHSSHILLTAILLVQGLWIYALSGIALKGICEYALLNSTSTKFGYKLPLLPFILLQAFYSPYVVLFGLLSQFAKQKWK